MRRVRLVAPAAALLVGLAAMSTAAAGAAVVLQDDRSPRPVASTPATLGRTPPSSPAPSAPPPPPTPAATARAPVVASLDRVVPPDLLVVSRHGIDRHTARRVDKLPGVAESVRAAAGRVRVGGEWVPVLGVDPSMFRAWTPLGSARSDALWQALAYDQLVLSFGAAKRTGLALGRTYSVAATARVPLRLGAEADLGLPHVGGLVTRHTADALGLTRGSALLVNAPSAGIEALTRRVRHAVGDHARVVPLRADTTVTRASVPHGSPTTYLQLYRQAATRCPGLSWTVLAAIGQVESGHGRNMGPSSAGAVGPMQFLPSTWSEYGVDGNGDGRTDVWDPLDAVPAAADYLCRFGAGRGGGSLSAAVFAYNHSDAYVREVLALADAYARAG